MTAIGYRSKKPDVKTGNETKAVRDVSSRYYAGILFLLTF